MSLFRTWWFAAGLFASGLASAAGCVKSEEVAPPGPKFPDQSSFCRALAEAACSAPVVNGCYGASTEDTLGKCRSAFEFEGCNPGVFGYHPEGAEACIEQQRAMYADGLVTQLELEGVHDVCLKALSNNAGAGTPCTEDAQCNGQQNLRCVIKPGQEGSCQIPVEVMGGDVCSAPDQVCPDDDYCNGSNCIARLPEGNMTCSESTPCELELTCIIPAGLMQGTCTAKKSAGEQCATPEECLDGFCSSITNTCRANVAFAGGDECDPFLPG